MVRHGEELASACPSKLPGEARKRGLARFEVLGLDRDRDLIRSVARQLAEDGPAADRLRKVIQSSVAGEPSKTGGILAALRRSPLVGGGLDLARPLGEGRKVER